MTRRKHRKSKTDSPGPGTALATTKPKPKFKPSAKYAQAKDWKDPRVGTMALWIDTPFGPIYPCIRPPHTVAADDSQTLQVRARRREILDHFRARWCPTAGEVLTGEQVTAKAATADKPAKAGHKTDYPYRCYVSPQDLAAAVGAMILKIDSEKFKPLTDGPEGLQGTKNASLRHKIHGVYSAMWSRQLDLTDGTSSYDGWGNYTAGSASKPDSRSPAPICRRNGHWFNKPLTTAGSTVGALVRTGKSQCSDCPAIRDDKSKKITYPPKAEWDPKGYADNVGTKTKGYAGSYAGPAAYGTWKPYLLTCGHTVSSSLDPPAGGTWMMYCIQCKVSHVVIGPAPAAPATVVPASGSYAGGANPQQQDEALFEWDESVAAADTPEPAMNDDGCAFCGALIIEDDFSDWTDMDLEDSGIATDDECHYCDQSPDHKHWPVVDTSTTGSKS